MKKKKWWDRLQEGRAVNVIVLQFDLGSHTQTALEMNHVQAFREFAEFGRKLEEALEPFGFSCLHWLGDGGLFVKEYKVPEDADSICHASDAAFNCFEDVWKSRSLLTLRATATLLDRVYISKEAGYWYSLGLNFFLKFERRIGRPGAFVITSDLKRSMSPSSASSARFTKLPPRPVDVDMEGVSFQAWTDSERCWRVEPGTDRFEVWLTKQTWPAPTRKIEGDGQTVGDSLVLGSALTKGGYESIAMVPVVPLPGTDKYIKDYKADYENRLQELASFNGKKGSVTTYHPPLTDDPTLRLEWQEIDYTRARAFHELVESDTAAWNCYRAASLATDPRPVPGILVTHNIMILRGGLHVPHLIFAHRKKGARKGGYYNNRWSVFFEEGFSPVQSVRDERVFKRDADLQSTIFRGAREEFLGEQFDGTCIVRIHAVQIEILNFNFGVMGAVLLRDMDFEEFAARWRSPDAIDRGEHDAVLAMPCAGDALRRCLESDRLPSDLWSNSLRSGRSDLEGDDHLWHPTSKARLAMCLWLLEAGAI
jgi:hypothetical protein